MSADTAGLTLPGSMPSLVRPCSPVHHPDYGDGVCVGIEVGDDIAVITTHYGMEAVVDVPLSELSLRLSDATGRAHAAWWLAEKHTGCPVRGQALFEMTLRGPLLILGDGTWVRNVWGPVVGHDPRDDRRLPDGSRWVDAEALRLVVLYVVETTLTLVPPEVTP